VFVSNHQTPTNCKEQQTPVFDNDDRAVQPLATALELLLQSRRLFLYSKLVVTGAFGPAPWRCQSQWRHSHY